MCHCVCLSGKSSVETELRYSWGILKTDFFFFLSLMDGKCMRITVLCVYVGAK